MLILAVQQTNELGMRVVVFPGEANQLLHAFARWRCGELQLLFGPPKLLVRLFQHAAKQLLLAAEVVIQHAIHGPGAAADPLDPRAAEAVTGELFGGGLEDLALHALRVALAANRSAPSGTALSGAGS